METVKREKERIIQAIYSGRNIQNALVEEYTSIDSEIYQIEQALKTIDFLEKSKDPVETFLPIAGHAFVPAVVQHPDKITVAIAKDVLVETTPVEARRILKKRRSRLEASAKEIEKALKDINSRLENLVMRYQMLERQEKGRKPPKPT